jgi:hypothetical protein
MPWLQEQPPAARDTAQGRRVVVVQHDRRWEGRESESHSPAVDPSPAPETPTTPQPPVMPQTPRVAPQAATVPTPPIVAATVPSVVTLSPMTQPIVVEGKLSLADVPALQLSAPGKPIPIQLPPLTVTLSPDSPAIRVIVEHVAATQPATSPAVVAPAAPAAPVNPPAPPPTAAVTSPPAAPQVAPSIAPLLAPQTAAAPQTTATSPGKSSSAERHSAGWGMTLLFLGWVLVAGALGGGLRYLLKNRERLVADPAHPLGPALATGALVAFLAPLALGLVAPDLLSRARLHQRDLLPALALCFVAGFASDALFARFRRRSASVERSALDPDILEALVETQVDLDSGSADVADDQLRQAAKSLDKEEAAVLRNMAKGPDRFRNERGLASRTALDLETVQDVLAVLQDQGCTACLAAPKSGERLWYLTRQGRRLAATLYAI